MSYIRVDEIVKNINIISKNFKNDLSCKNSFRVVYENLRINKIWSEKRINKRLNFKSMNGDVSILFDKFGLVKYIEIDGCEKTGITKIPHINRVDLMIYMKNHYVMKNEKSDYKSTHLCFPESYLELIFTESKGNKMVNRNFKGKLYTFKSPEGDVEISFDSKGYIESILI